MNEVEKRFGQEALKRAATPIHHNILGGETFNQEALAAMHKFPHWSRRALYSST